ncbi:hypothetical protein JTB14_012801 [Gonioctena quinquepunctata]|nr:hypothetical protein JTB14_012801 [Gonioctena quinquepunctata]
MQLSKLIFKKITEIQRCSWEGEVDRDLLLAIGDGIGRRIIKKGIETGTAKEIRRDIGEEDREIGRETGKEDAIPLKGTIIEDTLDPDPRKGNVKTSFQTDLW